MDSKSMTAQDGATGRPWTRQAPETQDEARAAEAEAQYRGLDMQYVALLKERDRLAEALAHCMACMVSGRDVFPNGGQMTPADALAIARAALAASGKGGA